MDWTALIQHFIELGKTIAEIVKIIMGMVG